MASDQADTVFTLVMEILKKVLEFNGDECIQYIDQDKLYFRVDEMLSNDPNSIDPANIVEVLTSELIIVTLSKKEEGNIVMDELTDEARILNSVGYDSLIPQEHTTPSFAAIKHATHSTLGSRDCQKEALKNIETSNSNREVSSIHVTSHSTYRDVFGDDSSSSSTIGAAHARTGAIPKRRIEKKKHSLAIDYIASQDKNTKGFCYGNRKDLEQSLPKYNRHNTANISERDTAGISQPRKVQLSEAVGIKSKIKAADTRENSVVVGISTAVSHVEEDESSYSDQCKDSSDDENEKLCDVMISMKEAIKKYSSVNGISNLSENGCTQSSESVLDFQSDPCNSESLSGVYVPDDISEAVKDASSAVLMTADHLPSNDVECDSDGDTRGITGHEADFHSCHSESEFEMCDDTADPKTASSCHSVSEEVNSSVHSTAASSNENFECFENEILAFSLLPAAGASHEKESLKLQDCEGDNDDSCEPFSMLSGASSLAEFSSSVACDSLLHASSQNDAKSVFQRAVECDDLDVLHISSEHSSNESISILQAEGEDTAGSSALNDDSHDSSVIVLDSPVFVDGSLLGQDLLENCPSDSPDKDECFDSLFMHAAVDKTMAKTSQSISVPTGRTKHSVCIRPSVRKPGSKRASSIVSSTHLTKVSKVVSTVEQDDEQAPSSSYGNAFSTSEPILTEMSVKKKKNVQPSSSKIVSLTGSQHSHENAAKTKLSSPPQSPGALAAATTTSRAAGQRPPNIFRLSALRDAGRGHGEVQIIEPNVTGAENNAGTSTADGKPCSFEGAQKMRSNNTQAQPENWMTTHCRTLYEVFPNVDENYLFDRCQELTGSEGRFEALLNELALIEDKPPKVLGASGQKYYSSQRHIMSLLKDSPNLRRPARLSENDLDLEATTVDGMPLLEWLQKEEYGAAEAAPRPGEEDFECGCCCSSYPVEEMRHCEGDQVHLFCHNCIRSYCEIQIGQSKYEMHCLSVSNCTALFSVSTLLNVLPTSVFENLMANKQAEDIAAANIDGLETCPFCPFSIIFDNKATVSSTNIVFRCDNPNCGKQSCRLCKKAYHSPAKCDEVRAQTDARTHLENEMTEAMVSSESAMSSGWWGWRSLLPYWRSRPSSEPQQQESQHEQQQQQPALNSQASSEQEGFQDVNGLALPRDALFDLASAPPLALEVEEEGGSSLHYDGTSNDCKILDKKRSIGKGTDTERCSPGKSDYNSSDRVNDTGAPAAFGGLTDTQRCSPESSDCKRSDHKNSDRVNNTGARAAFGGLVTASSAASALATISAVAHMAGYQPLGNALSVVGVTLRGVSAVGGGRGGRTEEVPLETPGAVAGRGEVTRTNRGGVTAGAGQSMPPLRSGNRPRECVQCHKRFIKQDGCNKMTCSCGAKMCYICKKPVTDYDHFDNNTPANPNKCPLYTPDLAGLHAKEVQERANALKRGMDPNLLLYDPTSS